MEGRAYGTAGPDPGSDRQTDDLYFFKVVDIDDDSQSQTFGMPFNFL